MAYPIWITKSGDLGIINGNPSENQYYEIPLEARDPNLGPVTYSFIAGELPPGIQITVGGTIQGVPIVTEVNTVLNRSYTFTARAKTSTGQVADRTFTLTVTNILPPKITPKVSMLGDFFDGQFFNLQLVAIEANPAADLLWEIESGSLPKGITLSTDGLLSGFIYPLPAEGNAGLMGYGSVPYSGYGYDQSAQYKSTVFKFTIRVSDGINYDSFSYTMQVTSKGHWTADSTNDLVNDGFLTVDHDQLYNPIMLTPQQSLPDIRSDSNFAFKFDAIDPNDDIISYGISTTSEAGFDLDEIGFDTIGYDQGEQDLPPGLGIDQYTGWLTGTIPDQSEVKATYTFQVYAYKRDRPAYRSVPVLYTLSILGDINNTITWTTASDLGTITNGYISDLSITATSNAGKSLVYNLATNSRLPQGFRLLESGLIVGRSTFDYFTLDKNTTTLDKDKTTFDNTYTFNVIASDLAGTVSDSKEFTVRIVNYNQTPFENLYLKALPSRDQRDTFLSIVNNNDIFPEELIYRSTDPFFGRARDIRSLFLAGLSPAAVGDYVVAMSTNHFNKRIEFSDIKTARALDKNFNVKYEVVYVDLIDEQTSNGKSPANIIDLTGKINPWVDSENNSYSIVYPNSFQNMANTIVGDIGYANQGALPEWMTSTQEDNKQLGFKRSIVLAYVKPGASKLIAYRLKANGIVFNNIDFVADRYTLDNHLTTNYSIDTSSFVFGDEITFDKIPRTSRIEHNVDYAINNLSFDMINNQTVESIRNRGGLDSVTAFTNGQHLIFARQENYPGNTSPNDGWNLITDSGTEIIPGFNEQYNSRGATVLATNVVAGSTSITVVDASDISIGMRVMSNQVFSVRAVVTAIDGATLTLSHPVEYPGNAGDVVDYELVNRRGGIWQVNISEQNIVTLSFVEGIDPAASVQVNLGFSYSSSILYYNTALQPGHSVPEYTILSAGTILGANTRFDNFKTKIVDNRDTYASPGTDDKYLKFPKIGVFK